MEELSISVASIVAHVLMTLIPWIIGIGVGGGLGALCGLLMRAIYSASPALRHLLVLLPWRTLGMGLLMLGWSPFLVTLLGIGAISGGIMVAASVCLLATAFTATLLVEHSHPSPLAAQFVGAARTLAGASGLIAAGVGLLGGGGLGHDILEAVRLGQYGIMLKGLLVVLALGLALDLALGFAQMATLKLSAQSSEPAMAKG